MLLQNSKKFQTVKKFLYQLLGKKYTLPLGCISTGLGQNVTVGQDVSFGGNVFLFSTAPINIGDFTMIAYGVTIHTSTHDAGVHPMRSVRIDRPVIIGKHVWIGAGAIIMPGVIVEDYSVIGAGSVVTAHVPMGAIVAGNPARIMKYRDKTVYQNKPETILEYKTITESFLEKDKICKIINRG